MNYSDKKYKASIDFEIKTYEIDIAGHVNNIVYVKWLEDLRLKLFEQILPVDNLLMRKLYPVVTSTNISYKKQLKLGDKVLGRVWVENVKHNMLFLKFNFTANENSCAFAEQKCIVMNLMSGKIDKEQLKFLMLKRIIK